MDCVRLYVVGDVIGVGFRAWTKIQAIRLGIRGWVRNLDNRVEVMAQGSSKQLFEFVNLVRKGPPVSRVDRVEEISEPSESPSFSSFEILR